MEVLPVERAAEAVHRQSTRGNHGKLVLQIACWQSGRVVEGARVCATFV